MGNPDIENQIDDQVMASTSIEPLQASTERNNIERPSIHLGNEDLNKHGKKVNETLGTWLYEKMRTRLVGMGPHTIRSIFFDWLLVNAEKYQSHVDYMARWLGLDKRLYFQHIRQQKDQILGHYDHNHYSDIDTVIEVCMLGSCFQFLAILLFQNIRDINGIEILKGGATGDPERSKDYSHLRKVIMEDQMETKKEMLSLKLQIPWLAVQAVVSYSDLNSELSGATIDRLAMSCFDDLYPRVNKSKVDSGTAPSGGFKHLLHIFHWTRTPEDKWLVETQSEHAQPAKRFATFFFPNATQLLGSSISFKKHAGGSGTNVIYEEKRLSGLMQMTPFHIFTYSYQIYRNLILFEQKYLMCGLPFTAYLACMKRLLQNKEDAKLMQQNGIVLNTLKGEKDVLDFVQNMADCLLEINAYVPDDLSRLSEKLIAHHERDTSRWYADFKSQLCPNRWIIISIIGAIALFILTTIQTIYSVLGYYHQN